MEKEATKERGPLEYLEKAWSQALVAVSTAEEEAGKLVHRLGEMAGWSQDEVKRQARELTERLVTQRRELEKNLEDKVRAALSTLRVPRREELTELSKRLETLTERLENLKKS